MHIGYYRILINKGERHENRQKKRPRHLLQRPPEDGYHPPSPGREIMVRAYGDPGRSVRSCQPRGASGPAEAQRVRDLERQFRKIQIIIRAPAASWGLPSPSATSIKHQASSSSLWRSSKLQAPSSRSLKRQASRPEEQGSSFKPQATSSKIRCPS